MNNAAICFKNLALGVRFDIFTDFSPFCPNFKMSGQTIVVLVTTVSNNDLEGEWFASYIVSSFIPYKTQSLKGI